MRARPKIRWPDEKQAAFVADVKSGMNDTALARKYETSRAAAATRRRAVLIEGGKISHNSFLQRHLGYKCNPLTARQLSADNPAVTEGRTLFPTRRIFAEDAKRLLISGQMNRKIGGKIQKGEWAGMPVFTLTLEERATCPRSCEMWRGCYGSGMPFSRRIVADPVFEQRLQLDVAALAMKNPKGFVVRLHVLGDFYSVAYVGIWRDLLDRFDALRVYGYTARVPEDQDGKTAAIGRAIAVVKDEFPDRFRIRWSRAGASADGTTVIRYRPQEARVPEGLVCAAERDLTACCSTCGMCWSKTLKDETIVFILHGNPGRKAA